MPEIIGGKQELIEKESSFTKVSTKNYLFSVCRAYTNTIIGSLTRTAMLETLAASAVSRRLIETQQRTT
jgi:hypothetical protein